MKFGFKHNRHCLLTFALFSMVVQVSLAQIEFSEHTIAGDFDGAYSVYAADVDSDGDMDVLGAAWNASDITWWENGVQRFTEHTIAGDFNRANSVYAADIDGDGDMDVLGTAHNSNDITWWENDGEQRFTEHTIEGRFDGACSVYAADVDSDGDMDVLGAAWNADDITWWENDGEQDFTEHTIAGNFDQAYSVYAADVDSDGDMDVLGAAHNANDITWWENDGEQDFTEHTIAGDFYGACSVYAADIDGDGDIDVLGAADTADDITWWENDGRQNFTEHTIEARFGGACSVYAADIDGDGDMDVLGAANFADDITWWENDGEQDFTEHTIAGDFDGARCVYAADMDGDGDMDVLGAASGVDDITLWESDLAVRMIEGFVYDFRSEQPLEGAVVTTSYGFEAITNEDGFWHISPVRFGPFDLTASITGYYDSTLVDLEVGLDDTLEIDFALLHPELTLSIEEFNETIPPDASVELPFTVINNGNGPLEWSSKIRLHGEMGADKWGLRRSYNASQLLDDPRLQGVVFVRDRFYVSGENDDNPVIYVFNRNGELINSFAQPGEGNRGFRDLAFDGELIWGSISDQIYGISLDGEVAHNWSAPINPTTSVAYDIDRDILWISSTTSEIIGCDRAGNRLENRELDRQDLRIYGLAYWREDPDDCNLYIFNKERDTNRHIVQKINPDGGDMIFVAGLDFEAGGSPAGAFITDQYDACGGWVFMDVVNNGADDRVDIWQLQSNLDWISVEPDQGLIDPGANQELILSMNTTDLDSTLIYEAELVFSKAVGGDDTVIPVTLTIAFENDVDNHHSELPEAFGITAVYPNPFNSSTSLSYSLPFTSDVTLNLYNLSGQMVETLYRGRRQSGLHSAIISADNLPSGLYIVSLGVSGQILTRKILLVK
jgi:hypothetical protein